MESIKEKAKELQNRLQFTIIVVLFFPTFLEYLFSYTGKTLDFYKVGLNWGLVFGLFVIIYVILEVIKMYNSKINELIFKIINWSLLIEIISFLPIIFITTVESVPENLFTFIYEAITLVSIKLIIYIPVAIIFLFITNSYLNLFSKKQT
ncbi:MAG TPA: hypothetical protein PKZ36_01690 [Candidatus Paceibacterota bacterium]|nr:hypothetical protein [Candidatus Paceibacterota bacterium]HPT18100.1 hypothetical protein [Candidatus Paceibacterota bacterium]